MVKALVVALLTLPVGAYVTGSLVDARSELPEQREPVLIGDRLEVEPQQTIRPEPTKRPEPDDGESVSVVRPSPRDIDDTDDDGDDGADDDSGDSRSGDDDD